MTHTDQHEQRPAGSGSPDPRRRPARRRRGDRRGPRPPVAASSSVGHAAVGLDVRRRPSTSSARPGPQRSPRCARRGRRCRPRRHDGLRRRRSRVSPTSIPISSGRCARPRPTPRTTGSSSYVNSGWRSPAYQEQLLREAVSKYGSSGGGPMGRHRRHVRARVGRRGRHRAFRGHGVAVRARRRVRAVPDLPQRTLALRAAPRGRRSRLPAHVRRPHARSADAAVTGARIDSQRLVRSSLLDDEAPNLPRLFRASRRSCCRHSTRGLPGHCGRRPVDDGLQPGCLDPRPSRRAHAPGRFRRVRLRAGRLDHQGEIASPGRGRRHRATTSSSKPACSGVRSASAGRSSSTPTAPSFPLTCSA